MSVLGIEKRTEKLFVRITKTNKKWIEAEAKRQNVSEAEWADFLIDEMRKLATNACHKPKSPKHPKKT